MRTKVDLEIKEVKQKFWNKVNRKMKFQRKPKAIL